MEPPGAHGPAPRTPRAPPRDPVASEQIVDQVVGSRNHWDGFPGYDNRCAAGRPPPMAGAPPPDPPPCAFPLPRNPPPPLFDPEGVVVMRTGT